MKPVKDLTLEELRKEIGEVQPRVLKALQEAGDTFDMAKVEAYGEGLDSHAKSTRLANENVWLQEAMARARELESAANGRKAAEEADAWLKSPADPVGPGGGRGGFRQSYKDLAATMMEQKDAWYRGKNNGPAAVLEISAKDFLEHEAKTVMSTGAGYAPESLRSGIVVPAAFQRPSVIDLIPVVRTGQQVYSFMAQTTRTNAAAEAAESVQGTLVSAAESAFAWTQVDETLRKINHFVPVTDEQLMFVEGLEDLIRNDMALGVRQRYSSQILNGDGSAPNVEGFYDAGRTGVNQVDATGMNLATAISEAIEDCQTVGFADPDGCVVHPTDWWTWKRTTTTDGIFINGHPAEAGPNTSWGLPVALTTETAAGQALVGAFQQYSRLPVFGNVEVLMSSEHASFFIQGVKAIKAEIFGTLAVLREAAFSEINNIGS